jgi:hypothetical protein
MPRKRSIPPTASSVRELATRRAYLIKREDGTARRYRIFSLSERRVAPVASKDPKHRYSWRLADADAWLRTQPLLRDL